MERVFYELDEEVAVIRLDDSKANAIQGALLDQMDEALGRAERDGAKALVLTGRPGFFSAGLDLRTLPKLAPEERIEVSLRFGMLAARLLDWPTPVIMALTGHTLAGGMVIALCGDRRIAAQGFKYGLNEVAAGIAMPRFVIEVARQVLAPRHLLEAVGEGRIYDGQGASDIDMIDALLPADEVLPAALAEARRLMQLDPVAYADTKTRLRPPIPQESIRQDFSAIATAGPLAGQ